MDACCRGVFAILLATTAQQAIAANHDFDGDRRDDVVWRHSTTGADVLWRSGEPVSNVALATVQNVQWKIVAVDDFDGDGRADLLWRNSLDGRNVIWRRAHAAMLQNVPAVPDTRWHVLGTGDFDGDGRADILWEHPVHERVIWPAANVWRVRQLGYLDFVAIADVDGDGRADLIGRAPFYLFGQRAYLAWSGADQDVRINLSANFEPPFPTLVVQGTGDFDGDGHSDLFLRDTSDGHDVLWPGCRPDRARTLGTVRDLSWNVVATGDYDGDGRSDLFWRNRVSGDTVLWLRANSTMARYLTRVPTQWAVVP